MQMYSSYREPSKGEKALGILKGVLCLLLLVLIPVLIYQISRAISRPNSINYVAPGDPVAYSESVPLNHAVYADIVSIEPVYSISVGANARMPGLPMNVICRCETESAETLWLYISVTDYQELFDSRAKFDAGLTNVRKREFSPARRVVAAVKNAEKLYEGLTAKTGPRVLRFLSLEEIP